MNEFFEVTFRGKTYVDGIDFLFRVQICADSMGQALDVAEDDFGKVLMCSDFVAEVKSLTAEEGGSDE